MEFNREKIIHSNLSDQERILKNREKGRNNPDNQKKISYLTAMYRAHAKIYVEADDTVVKVDDKKDEK
tara:strand:+ start:7566 stop:7769 length:204 start_codon:yes stop_codon:yes gene_type:complete